MADYQKVFLIRIDDEWYLGFDVGEDDIHGLDTLVNAMTKNRTVNKVLETIIPLWFKGKYYSTPKNYYYVLDTLNIEPNEYVEAMSTLVDIGVLVEVKERVYEIGKGYYVVNQSDIKE